MTGKPVLHSITEAEPIGPKGYFDVLAVAPCTGNTAAKLAAGITDAAVVVVRYFGGTLLGTGGLVRAYSSAAAECVQDAGTCEMKRASKIETVVDYSLIKPAQLMFAEMGAVTEDTEYSDSVKFTIWCLEDTAPSVIARLRDMSAGNAVTEITKSAFKPETFFTAKK